VLWRKDEKVEDRLRLVNEFKACCEKSNLPSIIEIIVKPPKDSSIFFDR
jgi:sulfofructosephosphate aldolase